MKAEATQIAEFMNSKCFFAIPVYQRNYDWEEPHCKRLFDDIVKAGQNKNIWSHFIGSIVYVEEESHTSNKPRELTIIDGQQRLTTLTLIFAALSQYVQDSGDLDRANLLRTDYLYNHFKSGNEVIKKPKLKPTQNNESPLMSVLEEEPQFEKTNSRIVKNYIILKKLIRDALNRGVSFDDVQNGLDKLYCVEIVLERSKDGVQSKDDVQRIFESLNSTGEALKQADLIRNYVLMGLSPTKQKDIYEKYWEKIEKLTKDPKSDKSMMSEFIRDYLTKNNRIPNEDRVYATFKDDYPTLTFDDLECLLNDLGFHADCYAKLIGPARENDSDITKHLSYIKQLKVNVAYPFLMRVYGDFIKSKIDKNIFVSILELVQSFVCRRIIVGAPANSLNKIFMGLHDHVKQVEPSNYLLAIEKALLSRKGDARFPSNSEVETELQERGIYVLNHKRYFLERLENFNNKEPIVVDDSKTGITIEHIFPQKPDEEWKKYLSDDEYTWMLDHVHTIGNLTLTGHNSSLANKYFLAKRDMDIEGKEQGYKFSKLWLNRSLELDKWDPMTVSERTKQLTERFLQVWKMPNVPLDDNECNVEVSISEAGDPTGKKLDYAIFFGNRIAIKNTTDLYVAVIKRLFEQQEDRFFKSPLKDRIKITSVPDKKGQYKQLDEVHYLDTHGSQKQLFDDLRVVLTEFEYDEDGDDVLMIKFV